MSTTDRELHWLQQSSLLLYFVQGYGFITAEDGTDLFVHQSEIRAEGFRNLAEGEQVEFVIQTSSDGRKKAVNVTGPNGAYVQVSVVRSCVM